MHLDSERRPRPRMSDSARLVLLCVGVPLIGRVLAGLLALIMNARGYLEELLTPEWVRHDNAWVYVTLSRPAGRSS
jgi:hypothetical protein